MKLIENRTGRRPAVIGAFAALAGVVALATPAQAVVGGADARAPEPWMASLQTKDGAFCGGTLIDSAWVLTAFHCVGDGIAKDDMRIRIGSLTTGTGGTVAKIQQIIKHPDAHITPDGAFAGPDLALLKLDKPVPNRPAKLNAKTPPTGTPARLLGWGNTCGDDFCEPEKLQELLLPLRKKVTDKLRFEDDKFRGSGPGDSGGPLVVKSGDGWRLAGVVSSGGRTSTYTLSSFTDVAQYRKWIVRSMKQH